MLATAVQAELQGVPKASEENGKDGFKDEVRIDLQCGLENKFYCPT